MCLKPKLKTLIKPVYKQNPKTAGQFTGCGPLTARFSNKHRNIIENNFRFHCEELQKISHANQKNKLNDRPRIKSNWAQQKMLAGVGWFNRELPQTPANILY